MKKATITIAFDQAKLKAVQFYMSKSGTSLESELDTFMQKQNSRPSVSLCGMYLDIIGCSERNLIQAHFELIARNCGCYGITDSDML